MPIRAALLNHRPLKQGWLGDRLTEERISVAMVRCGHCQPNKPMNWPTQVRLGEELPDRAACTSRPGQGRTELDTSLRRTTQYLTRPAFMSGPVTSGQLR
jgi:hypothetical protein